VTTVKEYSAGDLYGAVSRRFDRLSGTLGNPLSASMRRLALPAGDGRTLTLSNPPDAGTVDVGDGLLAVDEKTMSAGFVVSSTRRDRHGDVVVPAGCKDFFADYEANPVVFFAHKSDCLPIASARDAAGKVAMWFSEDKITSRAYFHGKTRESEEVFCLVAEGHLRAASIGFIPVEGKLIPPASDEPVDDDGNVDFDSGGLVFTKWQLLEWSVVPVPANADALRSRLQSRKSLSPSLRKSLEPFAAPARGDRPRFTMPKHAGLAAQGRRWNQSLSKAFDISQQKLKPATAFYGLASKYLGCEVKHISHRSAVIPSAKMGSVLSGWHEAAALDHKSVDVRNITHGGTECPPYYEAIRLNSSQSKEFLVEGAVFYDGKSKFIAAFQPVWYGLSVTLYSKQSESADSSLVLDRAWELAASKYNFLKGEAFSLSGDFIGKTGEQWEDLFLEDKNVKSVKRTLRLLNEKQADFANRGAIFLGPPGTGKTLSGRIIRNQADATFIWVSAKDFYRAGAFGGMSYAFELAKELSPSVIFFEDVDNWLDSHSVDLLKSEMDGIARYSGVWTVLTTNYPERLPKALIDRPGRFHDVLYFKLPDEAARKGMLARWLPELKGQPLADALKATKGYSGAHVYELCKFVKTLLEQEEKSLEAAVTSALKKIEEQRELIARPPRFDKSLSPMVASYAGRRSFNIQRKSMPTDIGEALEKLLADDLTKPPVQDAEDAGGSEEGEGGVEPQAIVFHTDRFHEEADVRRWLEDNGYPDAEVMPGGEGDEPWVAVLFPSEECEADTAERKEIEDGVELVTCTRGEKEGDGESEPEPESGVPDAGGEVMAGKAMDELPDGETAVKPGGESDDSMKPYGCQVLCTLQGHLEATASYLESAVGQLEQEKVKKWLGKYTEHLQKYADDLEEFACGVYPDHFKAKAKKKKPAKEEHPEPDGDEAVGDGDGDADDKGKGKKSITSPRRTPLAKGAVARKDVGVLEDTAEFLKELATEDNLKRSQKAACRQHAGDIGSLCQKYSAPEDAGEEVATEKSAAEDPALQVAVDRLLNAYYELTGEEI